MQGTRLLQLLSVLFVCNLAAKNNSLEIKEHFVLMSN